MICYEHTPGAYGQVRYHPLLLANKANTDLEEWFNNGKYLHFLLNKDSEAEFSAHQLPVEFEYSMRLRTRSFAELRDDVKTHVDRCLFQDLFRIMVSILEAAKELIDVTQLGRTGESIDDFRREIQSKGKSFHSAPFPKKIAKFEVDVQFRQYLDVLIAVNKARNCFEHRNGVLGPNDCNHHEKLVINHRYPAPLGKDGRPSGILDQMPGNEKFPVGFVEGKTTFRLGDRLTIEFQESYKLLYTINFALKGIVDHIYHMCDMDQQAWILKQFEC